MICLPKTEIEKLKKAIREGDFSVTTLYKMTSDERHELFRHYVGESSATFLNGRFEKAMVSKQKDSLKKWVEETFPAKAETKKTTLEKIDDISDVLNPEASDDFLRDLAATKLGFTVTREEAATIVEKAQRIEELSDQVDGIGLPTQEYLDAYNDMERYIQSLSPTHQLRIITSLWGRAAMLMRLSSIGLNIESNVLNTLLTEAEKRVASTSGDRIFKGDNSDLVKLFVKKNVRAYARTGYDFSRMNELSEGQRILNEEMIHTEGKKTVVRLLGRLGKASLKYTQGVPDVIFASRQFGTTANIMSTAIAKGEGLRGQARQKRARQIMLDSFLMQPTTEQGNMVRNQAQADAAHATYTEDSTLATKISLKIRQMFNDLAPDLRLGDLSIPFAKTPANVMSQGVETAGGGIYTVVSQMYKLKKAWQDFGKDSPEAKEHLRTVIRVSTKMGLGILIARVIVANIDDDDFIGAYPTSESERKLFEERNNIENSIRIGNKWVSTAYLGPLAPIVTGMLYAKKYKKEGLIGKTVGYVRGVGQGILELPGFSQARDTFTSISDMLKEGKDAKDMGEDALRGLVNFTKSRILPGILTDIAKIIDGWERKTKDEGAFAPLIASIPGWRESLPIKETTFGRKIKAEPAWSILFFGSRLKTRKTNFVIKELVRLQEKGYLPALTDIEKTSTRVKAFKTQVSTVKYRQAISEFKTTFEDEIADLIKTRSYKNLSDEEKRDEINDLKNDLLAEILEDYGYKAPKK